MEGITREQILQDIQDAIGKRPRERRQSRHAQNILRYLEEAQNSGVDGLTTAQLSYLVNLCHDWTGKILNRMREGDLIRREMDGTTFVWYIVCKENEGQG